MNFVEAARRDPILSRKMAFFEAFWRGEGPCPILFAKPHLALGKNYRRWNLREQHEDPARLLEEALAAALEARERPDDGIAVVRADLGTTLFPSALGLPVATSEEQHPSLAAHLGLHDLAGDRGSGIDVAQRGEFPLADAMYRLFLEGRASGALPPDLLPYLPDNQGPFDLCHLALGSEVFYAFEDSPEALLAAQERSLALFLAGSRHFKALLGEPATSMVHGHGMPSGAWFPDTGIRVSEDSCTLISTADIRRFCLPFIERAIAPFGRGFLHFCGRHRDFLRMACESPLVSTLNLGNPEMYELEEIFGLCGRTGTVYFGHLSKENRGGLVEGDGAYLERLAELAGRTACRLILVAPSVDDMAGAAALWHRLTAPVRPGGQGWIRKGATI